MSKPRRDPVLPESKQPMMECWTCGHFKREKRPDGTEDWLRGGCRYNGESTVPARHVCAAWCKRTKKEGGEE